MKALTFDDVLLVPGYNRFESRRDVSTAMTDKTGNLTLNLPLMSASMDTITEHAMANFMSEKGGLGVLHRFMNIEKNVEEWNKSKNGYTFVSVGASEKEMERFEALYDAGAHYFCVDVAHGHSMYAAKMLKTMRERHKNIFIMAGAVVTYAGADFLRDNGADMIRVGIGGGSVCQTRIKTGFGVPQLTAIMECSRVDRSIICDGAVRTPGDIVKALAFGADFIMTGSMLSGTHYTPGEVNLDKNNKYVKSYRGMASREVNEDYFGKLFEWKTAEGVATTVSYKDEKQTDEIIHDIVGGLRSGLTYAGATDIRDLQRKLDYVTITENGRIESRPHKLDK